MTSMVKWRRMVRMSPRFTDSEDVRVEDMAKERETSKDNYVNESVPDLLDLITPLF